MNRRINIYDAKSKLSSLIAQVEASGEPVVICRNNVPIVDLVPHKDGRNVLSQDPELAGAVFVGDPCAPLDEEDWPGELR